jgi:hypothetical protein
MLWEARIKFACRSNPPLFCRSSVPRLKPAATWAEALPVMNPPLRNTDPLEWILKSCSRLDGSKK